MTKGTSDISSRSALSILRSQLRYEDSLTASATQKRNKRRKNHVEANGDLMERKAKEAYEKVVALGKKSKQRQNKQKVGKRKRTKSGGERRNNDNADKEAGKKQLKLLETVMNI